MTNNQWGDPIDGPTMRSFKARGIDPETEVIVTLSNGDFRERPYRYKVLRFHDHCLGYRLPADHPYYIVKAHNEEHGTSFVPWFGRDTAPDDWDASKPVLFGDLKADTQHAWNWKHDGHLICGGRHIIGYHAKPAVEQLASVDGAPSVGATINLDNTVTLTKMTEAEAVDRLGLDRNPQGRARKAVLHALRTLKVVQPEHPLDRLCRDRGIERNADIEAAYDLGRGV